MLAVIPARGGSKGIPRKNVRPLAGKPLIVWTIEQALAVPELDVLVSTDDHEIAEVVRSAGAHVLMRPSHLAEDTTPTEPVVLHAITNAPSGRPDAVMLLQATSPIRLAGTLQRAVDQFHNGDHDSLVGVVACPPFLWRQHHDLAVPLWDWQNRRRRQDLAPEELRYRETGSVYVTRTEIYEKHNNRMGGRIGLFIMDDVEGTDIDTAWDLQLADELLRRLGDSGPTRQ